jgi:hypothetical protein
MCNIPVPIEGEEGIVRAINNFHVSDKGRLKTSAFRPKPGTDDLSVMRHTYLGSDACKTKAKEIVQNNPKVQYKGLAIIFAERVRTAGSDVIDSREGNYCGHAHISHGIIVPPPNEPANPLLVTRLLALRDSARYCQDPDPLRDTWCGEVL